jgi:hypothetical protein
MSESGVYEGGGQLGIFQGNPLTDQIVTGTNADTGQFEYLTSPNEYANYVNQERAAGRDAYNYNTAQYSGYLADQRQLADDNFRRSPAGQEWQRQQDLGTARKAQRDSKGTFNIIAGIVAAVAVVLTAGTALGFFGPAVAAAEGAAIGAGAGGLEGAVAAAVAEGAIEAGAATAALAEAAPAVAAIETGVSAAAGGAAGAAEVAAPSIFSSIIDGATSVYNAISGVVETVGNLTNISGPLGQAAAEATGINSTVADLAAKTLVGAGRGALTSGIQGGDVGLGALGGAAGGFVGAGARELLGAAGLGSTGFEGGIKGTLSSALGGGASGAARAAASGGDIGGAALRGLATGGASGAANYLLSDALGLGGQIGSLGGTLASNFVGSALAPDTPTPTARSREVIRVPRPRAPTPDAPDTPSPSGPTGGGSLNLAGLFDLGGGGSTGGGSSGGGTGVSTGGTGVSGVYGTSGASGGSGVTTSGTPSTISTSALASLLSSPSDPGYSSPLSDNTEPSSSQPSPWNRSSLRTTDPLGSSYG